MKLAAGVRNSGTTLSACEDDEFAGELLWLGGGVQPAEFGLLLVSGTAATRPPFMHVDSIARLNRPPAHRIERERFS